MDKQQYNFYTQNRPIKEAFIVNHESPDAKKQIDKIIEYNQYIWGGGYNQIILRNAKAIGDDWFNLLKAFDPDIIKTFEELPESIENQINFNLTPCYIEKIENHGLRTKGLLRFPTKENIYNNKLVLFKYLPKQGEENDNLRTFIQYNFGIFQDLQWQNHSIKDIEKKEIIDISNVDELSTVLEKQADYAYLSYTTYFSQIYLFAHHHIQEPENRNYQTLLTIFVGDKIEDIANYWNHTLLEENWRRDFYHKLFLPIDLIKNDKFMKSLYKWLNIHSDYAGNQHYTKLKFVSYSLTEQELEEISTMLNKYIHTSIEKRDSLIIPKFRQNFLARIPSLEKSQFEGSFPEPTQPVELHSVTNNNSIICTKKPSNEYGNTSDNFMTDIYIQINNTCENDYCLLKLPSRKDIAKDICTTGYTRVNSNNQISILRQQGNPSLSLSMPNENELFTKLLRDNNYNSTEKIIHKIKISDKGQYLKGFLELFSSIKNAEYFISNDYWDKVFKILSGFANNSEENVTENIKTKLSKHIQEIGNSFLETEEGIEFLSSTLAHAAKSFNSNDKGILYRTFLNKAKDEWKEYKKTDNYKERMTNDIEIEFSEEDLTDELNELIEKGILLLGISPKCPKCGTKKWYSINDIKQKTKCAGCNSENIVNLEEKWTYKLNTIIEAGYKNDIIPVILALNEIYSRDRKSFLYVPSINIYLKGNSTVFTDLDIACIRDGKFIIGEVKKHQKNFKPSDFDKLITVAKIIKPDIVIISSLDMTQAKGPNITINNGLKKSRQELRPLGVKVEPIIYYEFPIKKENNFIDYIEK